MRDVSLMEIIESSNDLASHLLPDGFWEGISRVDIPGENFSEWGELDNKVGLLGRSVRSGALKANQVGGMIFDIYFLRPFGNSCVFVFFFFVFFFFFPHPPVSFLGLSYVFSLIRRYLVPVSVKKCHGLCRLFLGVSARFAARHGGGAGVMRSLRWRMIETLQHSCVLYSNVVGDLM